jgi:hypothetical protein
MMKIQAKEIVVTWIEENWLEPFWRDTVIGLAKDGILKPGGKFIFPNWKCVNDNLQGKYQEEILTYYNVSHLPKCADNPLWLATENADVLLSGVVPVHNNGNQTTALKGFYDQENLFLLLQVRDDFAAAAEHPYSDEVHDGASDHDTEEAVVDKMYVTDYFEFFIFQLAYFILNQAIHHNA